MLTTTNPLEEDLSALPREVSTSPLEAWGTNQIIGKICPDPRVNRRDKNALYSVIKSQLMVCSQKCETVSHLPIILRPSFVVVRLVTPFTIVWNFWEVPSLGLCWNLLQFCQTLLGQHIEVARSKDSSLPGPPPSYRLTAGLGHNWASRASLRQKDCCDFMWADILAKHAQFSSQSSCRLLTLWFKESLKDVTGKLELKPNHNWLSRFSVTSPTVCCVLVQCCWWYDD